MLYLLSPFLNRVLHAVSRREYERFLLVLTIIWCVIPTFTHKLLEQNNLLLFIYLYCLIGYIKIHRAATHLKASTCILIAATMMALVYLSAIVFDVVGKRVPVVAEQALFFFEKHKIPMVIASVMLVIGFGRIDLGSRKWINVIASGTFGVYLIHENSFLRPMIWGDIFKTFSYAGSGILVPYSIGVILLVFICGTVIELFRKNIIDKNMRSVFSFMAGKMDAGFEKLLSLKLFADPADRK